MDKHNIIAIGEDYPNYFDNIISITIINQYVSITKYLRKEWEISDDKKSLNDMTGCLDKFSGVLFQISRLIHHQNVFLRNVINFTNSKTNFSAFSLNEACYDFEALLFLSRSSLDRITHNIKTLFKIPSRNNRFSSLRNMIANNCPGCYDKKILLSLLDESKWLEDFMITHDKDYSLRDMLAHYSSFSERTEFCGNIIRIGKEEVIAGDLESCNIALFDTTWKVSYYLPFLILNLLAHFSGQQTYLLKDYVPSWKNWTIKISEFLGNKDNQPLDANSIMLAKSMNSNGFEIRYDNLLPAIHKKKISYCSEKPRYTNDKLKEGWTKVGETPNKYSILIK